LPLAAVKRASRPGDQPAETQSREDTYLLNPQLRGLSVKVRGGSALEVKVYRGSPGILEVPGRARGRMQSWQKWSFPFSLDSRGRCGVCDRPASSVCLGAFGLADGHVPGWSRSDLNELT